MKNKNIASSVLILCLLKVGFFSVEANQDYSSHPEIEFTTEPLSHFEKMNVTNDLGDSYDPITGLVSFSVTDVSIPGNSGLSVELRRTLSIAHNSNLGNGEFGMWSAEVPYILGHYTEGGYSQQAEGGWHHGKVCSGSFQDIYISGQQNSYYLNPKSYWSGKLLHIPGKVTEKFLNDTTLSNVFVNGQVTKSNYGISSCTTSANSTDEGIVVKGPDGTSYTFNYSINRNKNVGTVATETPYIKKILVTQVKDKFGNTVNYRYIKINGAPRLSSIESSGGRKIELIYNDDGNTWVDKVIVNGNTWSYIYFSGSGYLAGRLKEVVLPDGRKWDYSYSLYSQLPGRKVSNTSIFNGVTYKEGTCFVQDPNSLRNFTVVTPSGLTINYTTKDTYFGRTNVDPNVQPFKTYLKDYARFSNVSCDANAALVKKTVTGPGISTKTWNYSYSQNTGKYSEEGPNSFGFKANSRHSGFDINFSGELPESVPNRTDVMTTTINGPENIKRLFINRDYKSNYYGKVLAVDILSKEGNLEERQESYFSVGNKVGDAWYREPMNCSGGNCFDLIQYQSTKIDEYRINLSKQVYKRGEDSFTTEFSNYDDFGFALDIEEYSNTSNETRFIRNTYLHEISYWILGLPRKKEISSNGVNYTTTDETTYHDFSNTGLYQSLKLPYEKKVFGEWVTRTSLYHSYGLPKRVEFNSPLENNSTSYRFVELLSYKRGLAQIVEVPKRYSEGCNSISGCPISASRTVDNDGNITKITDFNGNTTIYRYDALRRLITVTPSDGYWSPTNISYTTSSGYFTQTISRGNYRKKITFDGLLRPILTQEWDNSDATGTSRYVVQQFNIDNLPTFISYPSTYSGETKGTEFAYDALSRLKREFNTVDGTGVDYDYFDNNQMKTTDARGNITTTTYRAFGIPSQSLPRLIEQPHGVTTDISYNLFDNVTTVAQGGISESRIYDSQQRLCRLVRPDVGHTAYSYNALGQPVWVAQGASGGATACNADSVTSIQKVVYSYDNLGTLRLKDYYDSTADKIYTYDNQGNLKTLAAQGAVWNYTYNSENLVETETFTLRTGYQTQKVWSIDRTYNTLGHVNSLIYPSGKSVNFAPNALGQPTTVGSYATAATYYPNGQLKGFTYGNGLSFSQLLDSQQRPEYQTVKRSSANVLNHRYQYDNNHNIDTISDLITPSKNISLTYDDLDRLDTAVGFWGNGSFDYDSTGNITQKTLGNQSLTYAYTNNRLTGISGGVSRTFVYDNRGNVTSNGQRSFSFNLANQLIGSSGYTYWYDGYNRRVNKVSNGKSQYSLYSVTGQLLMTEGDKGLTEYFYLGDKLIAKGSDVPTSDDSPGYTGHLEDNDIQLTYMQQRYYDPLIGRFYSNDPVGFTASNPMMFNRYAYANNNPYKFVDPDGRAAVACAVPPIAAGCAAVAQKVVEAVVIGVILAQNALSESPSDKAVGEVKEGKEKAKGEAGEKGQLEGAGGKEGALSDLGKLPLVPGTEWTSPDGTRTGGTLEDGRKVNVHPSGGGDSYPKGTSTLEIQNPNGKTEVKIRYPEETSS